MWLSEALVLGRMIRPRCTGTLFKYDEADRVESSCALGAALEALGYDANENTYFRETIIAGDDLRNRSTIYALEGMNDHEGADVEELVEWLRVTGRDFELCGRFVGNLWFAQVEPAREEQADVVPSGA